MKNCKFFGVKSSKKVSTKMCDKCQKNKQCTIETNTLMGTSVVVDRLGVTNHVLPKGDISDTELMFENFDGSAKKETVVKEKDTKKRTFKKEKVKRVTGISKLCRILRKQKVSDEDIEVQVTKLYIKSGMNKSTAQAKAKSCIAHMVWDRI